jgi:hypothetical protein
MKHESLESIKTELFQAMNPGEEDLLLGGQCTTPYSTIGLWTCDNSCVPDTVCIWDCASDCY